MRCSMSRRPTAGRRHAVRLGRLSCGRPSRAGGVARLRRAAAVGAHPGAGARREAERQRGLPAALRAVPGAALSHRQHQRAQGAADPLRAGGRRRVRHRVAPDRPAHGAPHGPRRDDRRPRGVAAPQPGERADQLGADPGRETDRQLADLARRRRGRGKHHRPERDSDHALRHLRPTLAQRVAPPTLEMLLRLVPRLLAGERPGRPQTHTGERVLPRRRPADGKVDWSRPGAAVYDFVRALTRPYPGAFSWIDGRRWRIWQAALQPLAAAPGVPPGEVLGTVVSPVPEACGKLVACGNGTVVLLEVEAEDGTVLKGRALAEQPWTGKRWTDE